MFSRNPGPITIPNSRRLMNPSPKQPMPTTVLDSEDELSDLSDGPMEMTDTKRPILGFPVDGDTRQVAVGFRHEKSLNGHSLTVLKSALQKYIRRGLTDKAIWVAGELLTFDLSDDERNKKRIVTNIRHRLQIIFLEDIGDFGMWPKIDSLIQQWTPNSIHEAVSLMCMAKKARIGSHAKAVATLRTATDVEVSSVLTEFPGIGELLSEFKQSYEVISEEKWRGELRRHLRSQNGQAVMWAWLISQDAKKRRVGPVSKPVYQVFQQLRKVGLDVFSHLSDIPEKWYKDLSSLKENFLTWMIPLLAILNDHPYDMNADIKYTSPETLFTNQEMNNPTNSVTFDSFVYDMHTGKKSSNSYKVFAKQGALVHPENKTILCPLWHKVYDLRKELADDAMKEIRKQKKKSTSKKLVKRYNRPSSSSFSRAPPPKKRKVVIHGPEVKLETEEYEFMNRIQINTSSSKTDVYLAVETETGKVVVVKGPLGPRSSVDFASAVNEWKEEIGLPFHTYLKEVKMIPDRWDTIPLGVRNSIDRDIPQSFLVSGCLFEHRHRYPTKGHQSKIWPRTIVINWRTRQMTPYIWNIDYFDLLDDPNLKRDYIYGLIARYITGVGDMADRNFLRVSGRLFSLDEETPSISVNTIGRCLKSEVKRQKCIDWLRANKETVSDWISNLPQLPPLFEGSTERLEELRDWDRLLLNFADTSSGVDVHV